MNMPRIEVSEKLHHEVSVYYIFPGVVLTLWVFDSEILFEYFEEMWEVVLSEERCLDFNR